MDIDSFSAVREQRWQRLSELTKRRRLTGVEVDELARLYQLTATDLSTVRSSAPDPTLISRLSTLLALARASIAGGREPAWKVAYEFALYRVPAALFRIRWMIVGVMAGSIAISLAVGWYYTANPELLDELGSYEAREEYANEAFADYYSENPSFSFFARVWTNNSWVALVSVAGGITGFITVYVEYANSASLGVAGAVLHEFDGLGVFFQLIIPHGLLELTAVWVAGAAGLRLFWAMMVPGGRPRLRAMAEEGRSMAAVALGLVYVLFTAGLIEGFVTGSPILPWIVKDAIGVVVLAAFWVYVLVFGRRAVRAGHTGDLTDRDSENFAPVAA